MTHSGQLCRASPSLWTCCLYSLHHADLQAEYMTGSYTSVDRGRNAEYLLIIRMLDSVYSTANRVGDRKKKEACNSMQQSHAKGICFSSVSNR